MTDSNGVPNQIFKDRTIRLGGYHFLAKKCDGPIKTKNLIINYPNNNAPIIQDLGDKEAHYSIVLALAGKGKNRQACKDNLDFQKSLIMELYDKQTTTFVEPTGKKYLAKIASLSTENVVNGVTYTIDLIIFHEIKEKPKETDKAKIKEKSKKVLSLFDKILIKTLSYLPANVLNAIAKGATAAKKAVQYTTEFVKDKVDKWNNIKKTIDNTVAKVREKILLMKQVSETIVNEFNRPNQWLQQANAALNDLTKICQTPTQIFRTLNTLCNNLATTFDNIKDFSGTALKQDFGWSKRATKIKVGSLPTPVAVTPKVSTNAVEIQKELANKIIDSSMKISLLTSFTDFGVDIGFNTSEDINLFIESFDFMYNDIMENEFIDFEVKKELIEYKQLVYNYIDNQNVKKIIEIDILTPTPLTNIVFNYYGNLDYYNDILKLNENIIIDIFSVYGTIKMFED